MGLYFGRNWVCKICFACKDEIVDDGKYFAFKSGIDYDELCKILCFLFKIMQNYHICKTMNFSCFSKYHKLFWILVFSTHTFHRSLLQTFVSVSLYGCICEIYVFRYCCIVVGLWGTVVFSFIVAHVSRSQVLNFTLTLWFFSILFIFCMLDKLI